MNWREKNKKKEKRTTLRPDYTSDPCLADIQDNILQAQTKTRTNNTPQSLLSLCCRHLKKRESDCKELSWTPCKRPTSHSENNVWLPSSYIYLYLSSVILYQKCEALIFQPTTDSNSERGKAVLPPTKTSWSYVSK